MKSANYIITSPNLFSVFAFENNSFCFVAYVKYQNYEICVCITLSVGYGLASRRYYLFNYKLQDSRVSENTLMFLACQIKRCYSQRKGFGKKDF